MTWIARVAALLCAFVLLSCHEEPTQIIVSVDSNFAIPSELDRIVFRIEEQAASGEFSRIRNDVSELLDDDDRARFPLTLALTSVSGGRPTVRVSIEGYLGEALQVRRQAIVGFRTGKILSLSMNLVRQCALRFEACEAMQQTCRDDGECEPLIRDDLPTWSGRPPVVNGPAGDAGGGGSMGSTGDGGDSSPQLDAATDAASGTQDGGQSGGDAAQDAAGPVDAGADDAGSDANVPVGEHPVSLGLGEGFGCLLTSEGRVFCWGRNNRLQLGTTEATPDCNGGTGDCVASTPVLVSALPVSATQLSVGQAASCVVGTDGRVYCWGSDSNGQLGNGGMADPSGPRAVRLDIGSGMSRTLEGADRVAVGRRSGCARIAESRAVKCWGSNDYKQLADDTALDSALAIDTLVTQDVDAIGLGHYFGCVIRSGGALHCWGRDLWGQLGADATGKDPRATPIELFGSGVTDVFLGDDHGCAFVGTETRCWGRADHGQLGIGAYALTSSECGEGVEPGICLLTPAAVDVSQGTRFTQLGLGTIFSCGVTNTGDVLCWGDNFELRAGQPTGSRFPSPTRVDGISDARLVAAGFGFACAVTEQHRLYCWGLNDSGQLGPNATVGVNTATPSELPLSL
jgi:alpha-tubulin suppressor-like RCC1 family protein